MQTMAYGKPDHRQPQFADGPRNAETAVRRFRAPGRSPREVGLKSSIRRFGCHVLRINVNRSAIVTVVHARIGIRLHPLVVGVERRLEEQDGGDAARYLLSGPFSRFA